MVNTIIKNKPVIVIELQGGYHWETALPDVKQKMINSVEKLKRLGYVMTRIYIHDYLAVPMHLMGENFDVDQHFKLL